MLCNISFLVIDLELDTTINVGVVFLMPKDYLLVWVSWLGLEPWGVYIQKFLESLQAKSVIVVTS